MNDKNTPPVTERHKRTATLARGLSAVTGGVLLEQR